DVEYCYLFGSYAKGSEKESSDIDLLLSTSVTGMAFYGLIESLRTHLKKKVDVITAASLKDNPTLINAILKDGVKIYG
ncbi:MAG: nucleotidyltransferase family protein, partial [Candidatus Izemoplasmataceae bacterium]